ncbi:MAG: hypothetical protein AAF921_02065 [Cyanobacteria bacterium P01_D01_bin.44]
MVNRIVQAVMITVGLQMIVAFKAVSTTPATQTAEIHQTQEPELMVSLAKVFKGAQ